MSSRFLTKRVSNQYPQLQTLAKKNEISLLGSFQKANNKGADQTALMRSLVCACIVRKLPKTGFLAPRVYNTGVSFSEILKKTSNYPGTFSVTGLVFNKNVTQKMLFSVFQIKMRRFI